MIESDIDWYVHLKDAVMSLKNVSRISGITGHSCLAINSLVSWLFLAAIQAAC